MPVTYVYPVNREMFEILPDKIARVSENRVGLQILPIHERNASMIEWTQKDNSYGLQQLRGYEGEPTRIKPLGSNTYFYTPGVYGEYFSIGEQELATKAGSAQGDVIVDLTAEILEYQDRLTQREMDRIEQIIWLLLVTGTFSVGQARGDGSSVVMFTGTFPINTLTVGVTWATRATATPLENIRQLPILTRGKGLNFRTGATMYMNQATFNNMMGNTNPADLGGKKAINQSTLSNRNQINDFLRMEELPEIVIYDELYYDDNNAQQLYIPNGKVVVIGGRTTGERIGEYVKTINVYAGRQPKSYSFVLDYTMGGQNGEISNFTKVGKGMEIHQGHNGGPVLFFPGAVYVLNV